MACTACLPGNIKCHRSLLVELTLTWVNLASVQSCTRVIHHSGQSSQCNWHIKKICSDSIIDALPEAKVSLLWGSDVIISHLLGLTQTLVRLKSSSEENKRVVCLWKGPLKKTWVGRKWKMRKLGRKENKTGIFEKNFFCAAQPARFTLFAIPFHVDSAIWGSPHCVVRIQSWVLPRAKWMLLFVTR